VFRVAELGDYVIPFAIRAVCDLGVADLLIDGPLPVSVLAAKTGSDPSALLRTLRALAARGIFSEVAPSEFALTPLAQPLRGDHPLSLRDAYPLLASDVAGWARFDHTLRTGAPAFDQVHGCSYWDHLAAHPEESERVDRWMSSVNRLHLRTVLSGHRWGGYSSVVDVGGGNGAFLAGLLARQPRLRGTLFDLPHVVAAAPARLAEAGVADRCAVVAGSFFDDPVPPGADAYVLKTVLPGFGDTDVARILANLRAAMRGDSVLLLLEAILPEGDAFDVAKLFDVHTMMLTGGAHRTRADTEALLAASGLRLATVTPTPTLTILVARPAF